MLDSASSQTLSIQTGFPQRFFLAVVDVGVILGPLVAANKQFGVLLEKRTLQITYVRNVNKLTESNREKNVQ